MNIMKLYKNLFSGITMLAVVSLTACTGDLNVTPIDPNLSTPNNVLTSESTYNQLLAKCYSGLSVSSPDGASGDPDISGIDGGFGQYLRGLYYLNEFPTDEAVVGWNDQTISDLHKISWSSTDKFVSAMYSRLFYQISLCNEVIRRIKSSGISSNNMTQYLAEARCLRALSYYHAIDIFGNVPYTTEDDAVGGSNPKQISRADLFKWLTETEIPAFINDLPDNPENYRCGKGLAYMIMAKLYLNAKVYSGTAAYDKCADYCSKIVSLGYSLESKANYKQLFGASNDKLQGKGHEIIFSVYQDATNTQNYGGTTFLLYGEIGGKKMKNTDYGTTSDGWGGMTVTPQFADKFTSDDVRNVLFTNGQSKEIKAITTDFAGNGYAFPKFTNLKSDGTYVASEYFCNADFPVFRLADVYLMLAECQVVGGVSVNVNGMTGLQYFNAVRTRAGVSTMASVTANDILDERARELTWECHRRSDLIRFGELTTTKYLWAWKGNTESGTSVDDKYNLFPIPAADLISNTNLKQNEGY
jgi:hypothetical protein